MFEIALARRYAQALIEIATLKQAVEQFRDELSTIIEACEKHPHLRRTLEHPRILQSEKKTIVASVFARYTSKPMLSFINLLIEKRRIQFLHAVRVQYNRLADAYTGILDAEVRTRFALTDEQRRRLMQVLCGYTGKRIRLIPAVDPLVLGGISVRMKDTVLDGTVVGYLKRLKEKLLTREATFAGG